MSTEEKILKLIADQFVFTSNKVTTESKFVDDLCFDSLDGIEFVMELEDEFAVLIDDEDMESWVTVGDAIRYVDSALSPSISEPSCVNKEKA